MEKKQDIRNLIYRRRKEADPDMLLHASAVICDAVTSLPQFQQASWIYAYMDFNREVGTRSLIETAWKQGKRTAVPKVVGKDLIFYEITSFEQLKPGYFQIPEPEGCPVADCEKALLIVPGVAFDTKRHRIGYGQGFYDRYLSRHSEHTTVAVAFDFQVLEEVPSEDLDILPQTLITETRIIK